MQDRTLFEYSVSFEKFGGKIDTWLAAFCWCLDNLTPGTWLETSTVFYFQHEQDWRWFQMVWIDRA